MSKFVDRIFTSIGAHPSDAVLSSILSGEMPDRKLLKSQKHLQRCWQCRSRYEQLDRAALRFVEYHNSITESKTSDMSNRREVLRLRMQQVEREMPRASMWPRLLTRLRFATSETMRIAMAGAAIVLMAATALVVWQRNAPTVSAAEILRRASIAQVSSHEPMSQPVVYQKLNVRRRSSRSAPMAAMTVELWTDVTHSRSRTTVGQWSQLSTPEVKRTNQSQDVKGQANAGIATVDGGGDGPPPLLAEIAQAYDSNQLDWRAPLSPAAFRTWRDSVATSDEAVQKITLDNGQVAYAVKAVPPRSEAPGAITEAQLVIRADDWHAIAEYLKVHTDSGEREYEIAELDYRLAPLSEMASTIFPSLAAPLAALPALPRLVAAPLEPAELDAAEVEARVALHSVGADLGEPVDITRSPHGEIIVQGLANTEQHKQYLLQALQTIPHVVARIETIDELAKAQAGSNAHASGAAKLRAAPSASGEDRAPAEAASVELPLQSHLEQYFMAQRNAGVSSGQASASERAAAVQDAQAFSTKVLGLSDKALSEAWALRQLSKRYSPEESSKLAAGSKRQLESVVRDHVQNLQQHIDSLQKLLTPVLVSVETPGAPGPHAQHGESASAGWPMLSLNLFNTVNMVDRLNNSLFAGAGLPPTDDSTAHGKISAEDPGRVRAGPVSSIFTAPD